MNGCFGCDPANPVGLGITFAAEPDGRLVASWVPHRHHVGIGDVVNGGLLSLLAEELAAAVAAREWDGGVVVIRTEIRFHRPARVQTEL
ncbi:MAG TPA: hotdog domain-containing protein, partial [Micromonospora sp.]